MIQTTNIDPQTATILNEQYEIRNLDGEIVQVDGLGYPIFYQRDSNAIDLISPSAVKFDVKRFRQELDCTIRELEPGLGAINPIDFFGNINVGTLINGDNNIGGIGGENFFGDGSGTDPDFTDFGSVFGPDGELPIGVIIDGGGTDYTVDINSNTYQGLLGTIRDLEIQIDDFESKIEACENEIIALSCFRGEWSDSQEYTRNQIVSFRNRYHIAVSINRGIEPFSDNNHWRYLKFLGPVTQLQTDRNINLVSICEENLNQLIQNSEDLIDIVQVLIRCREGLKNRILQLEEELVDNSQELLQLGVDLVNVRSALVEYGVIDIPDEGPNYDTIIDIKINPGEGIRIDG